MKIAVTTSSFGLYSPEPLELLAKNGATVITNPHGRPLTEDEAAVLLQGCVGMIAGTEPLTERVFSACPTLRVISRCGVGIDNIALQAAKEKGIAICTTPDAPTHAVVELTLGYALSLMRKINEMNLAMHNGIWKKNMGCLLSGKQVGIIGFGRIGRSVAALFSAMHCKTVFFDPYIINDPTGTSEPLTLPELLGSSDIITMHCAKPEDSRAVLGSEMFPLIKKGAWLINAARGGLIDEVALYEALQSGQVAGAALDVFAEEPYTGALATLPNVILTPHIGSYAKETRIQMEIEAVTNLLQELAVQ